MAIKIKDLIEKLKQQENQDREVEYIICATDGMIIAACIETKSNDMKKMLNVFR